LHTGDYWAMEGLWVTVVMKVVTIHATLLFLKFLMSLQRKGCMRSTKNPGTQGLCFSFCFSLVKVPCLSDEDAETVEAEVS